MSNEQSIVNISEAMKMFSDPVDVAEHLELQGVQWLTIRAVSQLTGLSREYIRRRCKEGRLTRSYDERGRVIVPMHEIITYLKHKRHTKGTVYVIRLTDQEKMTFDKVLPVLAERLEPRYDPDKAKDYRRRKKAQRGRGATGLSKTLEEIL